MPAAAPAALEGQAKQRLLDRLARGGSCACSCHHCCCSYFVISCCQRSGSAILGLLPDRAILAEALARSVSSHFVSAGLRLPKVWTDQVQVSLLWHVLDLITHPLSSAPTAVGAKQQVPV